MKFIKIITSLVLVLIIALIYYGKDMLARLGVIEIAVIFVTVVLIALNTYIRYLTTRMKIYNLKNTKEDDLYKAPNVEDKEELTPTDSGIKSIEKNTGYSQEAIMEKWRLFSPTSRKEIRSAGYTGLVLLILPLLLFFGSVVTGNKSLIGLSLVISFFFVFFGLVNVIAWIITFTRLKVAERELGRSGTN